MVDLAYTDSEMKDREPRVAEMPPEYNGPKYPWGLSIQLESSSLEKLGKSVSDFKVGQKIPLTILAEVQNVSMSENADGSKHECVGLLCSDIELGREQKSDAEVAEKMYRK